MNDARAHGIPRPSARDTDGLVGSGPRRQRRRGVGATMARVAERLDLTDTFTGKR